jgi:hypothetical protein
VPAVSVPEPADAAAAGAGAAGRAGAAAADVTGATEARAMATRPQAAIATAGAYRERGFMVIAPPFLRSTARFECLDADWHRFVGIFPPRQLRDGS